MSVRIISRRPDGSPKHDELRPPFLEDFMAIQPSALERSFFLSFAAEAQEPYQVVGSVGIVTIDGPLLQRGGFWFDGYQSIMSRFGKALGDRAVSSVVLKINSPGGVCAGCFSAVRAMRAMKDEAEKPVFAFADEMAFSAAYAMACIADEIYLPPEGGVGSVGVIGTLEDWSGFNESMGIKIAVITSGQQKADGHPDVPLSQAVLDRYQARIDELARSFAEVVGASRELAPEDVLGLEAACLYGKAAVTAGLADGIATLEDTIAKAQSKGARAKTTQIRRHV